MTSSEDERYSRFQEERRVVFQDRTNLPGRDPVGTRPGRSSHSHRRAGSSPRRSPHRYRRSHSAQQPASRRHRSPQRERRSRWDQRPRHHQSQGAGHQARKHRSRSDVGQPHRDGPRDVSRNPSGSRRVSPVDSEGAAARRGPGERQRQHTSASSREVGSTAAAEDENQVEVLRLSHRELTQMIRESTSTASATAVLPGGYQNLKVQIPGSREGRPIPVVVSIPRPSFPRPLEPTATVSVPPRPACEPAATVSAPQPLGREPAATVSAPPQASQEPETSDAQKPAAPSRYKECLLCQKQVPNLRRHVETYHLPWYFVPELACWKCQQTAYNLSSLLERHVGCGFQGHYNDQRYLHWLESMKAFLDQLNRICGYQKSTDLLLWCCNARFFPQDVGVILSPTRECLLRGLDKSLGGNAEAITIQPPNCVAAILNWNSLYCIMQRLFDSQREDLRTSPLMSSPLSPADVPVLAVDGHCHVDTLANQLGLSIEEALRQCQEQAPEPRLRIVGVISNCVFPSSWLNPPQVPPTSSVEVHRTYGVHPRVANTELDWFTLNGLFQDRSCVAIGECGLDYTAADIEKQREVFRRQVQMAKLLGKPLVLHLRGGKYEGAVVKEESVYEEAFRMLVGELQLPRAHPLYIHCYVGGWKMCLKFQGKFKRVLFGLTVRSTEHEDFPKIAKGLGFERLALETDAPYLPPPGHNPNHPWLIHHQASLVAQHRNLPVSAVLEGATANVRRFFRI